MAEEKKTPLENELAPAAMDPAAGASAYVDASAGGEINLGDLGLTPARAPGLMREGEAPTDHGPLSPPGPPGPEPPPAAGTGAAPGPAGGGAGAPLSAPGFSASPPKRRFSWLSAFFHALGARWKSIPPLEDIFDRLLASLGLQRKPDSMLRRANSLAAQGRLAEAIAWYRNLLNLRPLSVAAYDGLGRAYFRMGLSEEADREFTVADCLERLLHNRDDIEAAAHLAQAMVEKRQAKMAVPLLEPVLVAHFYTPNNADLLKAMGRAYMEVRATKKVFQVYQAGLAQYPDDYEFYLLKGDIDLKLGNVAEGERLLLWGRLMKRLREHPGDPNAKISMGELYLKEDRTEEGLKLLKEAAALLPDNTGIRWRLFNLYQKQGHYEHSLKYFLEVVNIEPDNEELRYRLADFYRHNNHREEALTIYRELAAKHPRDPKPHTALGDLLSDMGQFEEGQAMRELGLTLAAGLKPHPDHRDTMRFMKYLFSVGETAEGVKWLDRALAQWPYHGEFVITKVKMLYNECRYQEAVVMLKRLIAIKGDVAEPHMWVGMCYQRLGDNMAALAEAQLATRLAPKSFTAHKVLGDILKEQRKLSQANATYEVAEMLRQSSGNR